MTRGDFVIYIYKGLPEIGKPFFTTIFMENKKCIGAEVLLRSLIAENVDTIFGYPGAAIAPVYDKLHLFNDKLKHYLARHEQGAAHAAQAYAMVTGKVGVCIVTSGPGATNLITGITNAFLDSIPMVFVSAQVNSSLISTDAFQETDILGASMPVTKWNCQVNSSDQIAPAIAKAFYIAQTGRKGPVLIDITRDAFINSTNFNYEKCSFIRSYNPSSPIKQSAIESAAVMINHAEKPMILAGHGVILAKAEKELVAFAEKSGIPVACTLMGLSCFPTDHHLYAGMLGMHGNLAPNVMTNEADLIIAIGMRFSDRVTGDVRKFARKAKIIHIEIDEVEINKNVAVDISINADAKMTLEALYGLIKPKNYELWLQELKQYDKKESDVVIQKELFPEKGAIRMGEVVNAVAQLSDSNAIIVTDVGQNQMNAARYSKFTTPNSFITSGGLGTMGFGLPAAIGAKIANPNREVILFVGDGGFQMTIQELGTILHYSIPIKIVVMRNGWLGMVRQTQELYFNANYSGSELVNPDFTTIAAAYSIAAQKVTTRGELHNAIKNMLQSKSAYLLDIEVESKSNVFPIMRAGQGASDMQLESNIL